MTLIACTYRAALAAAALAAGGVLWTAHQFATPISQGGARTTTVATFGPTHGYDPWHDDGGNGGSSIGGKGGDGGSNIAGDGGTVMHNGTNGTCVAGHGGDVVNSRAGDGGDGKNGQDGKDGRNVIGKDGTTASCSQAVRR